MTPDDEPPDLPRPPDPEVLKLPIVPRPESFFFRVRQALGTPPGGTLLRPAVLRIEPEHVRWRDTEQGAEVALPLDEIWAAHKEGRGLRERLVFRKRENGVIAVLTAFLPEPGAADAVFAAVRERIGALPDGPQRLEGIAARAAVAERLRSGRQIVAPAVAAVLALVFLGELAAGAVGDPIRLWGFGASSLMLLVDGQLFRLATPLLLHASLLHLLFNVVALVGLGRFLEPLLGSGRFLSILLLSALAGSAVSAFHSPGSLTLGASASLAGLLAACLLILRHRSHQIAHPPTRWIWGALVLAAAWPALVLEHADWAAHLGGLFAGFVLTARVAELNNLWEIADVRRASYRGAAALLAALFAAAGGMAVWHAQDPQRRLADAVLLGFESDSPSMNNRLAWQIVTSPDASENHLWRALHSVNSVVEDEPGEATFRDTQATAHYRLGHWEEAVRIEHEVLAEDPTPFHAAQLARFEWALLQASGPLLLGQPPKELPRTDLLRTAIFLDATQLPPGAKVHLILAQEKKAAALLAVTVGVSGAPEPLFYTFPENLPFPRPDQVSLALVDTRPAEGPTPRETRWKLLPIVPEAARLP